MPPPWIVKTKPIEGRRPVFKDTLQRTGSKIRGHIPFGQIREPQTFARRLKHEGRLVQRKHALDVDGERLAMTRKLPSINCPARHARPDTRMRGQVGGRQRLWIVLEIGGAAHNRESLRVPKWNGNHVLRQGLGKPYA